MRRAFQVLTVIAVIELLTGSAVYGAAKWAAGNFTFRTNVESFATQLGLTISADHARSLVANSLSTWKERTGAALNLAYGNDIVTGPGSCTLASPTLNGFNEVGATSGCSPADPLPNPPCSVIGDTTPWFNADGTLREADVCVYRANGAIAFFVRAEDGANSSNFLVWDLISVLTHELGHALGLPHLAAGSLMADGALGSGNTRARYPFGTDFDAILNLYGGITPQNYFVRQMSQSSSTWGGQLSGSPFFVDQHVNAAIGYRTSGTTSEIICGGRRRGRTWLRWYRQPRLSGFRWRQLGRVHHRWFWCVDATTGRCRSHSGRKPQPPGDDRVPFETNNERLVPGNSGQLLEQRLRQQLVSNSPQRLHDARSRPGLRPRQRSIFPSLHETLEQ